MNNLKQSEQSRDRYRSRGFKEAKVRDWNIVLLLFILVALFDEELDLFILVFALKRRVSFSITRNANRRKGSIAGRRWSIQRNKINWISEYAIKFDFQNSNQWTADFRIPVSIFNKILDRVSTQLSKKDTNFRDATPSNVQLAPFLMYVGDRVHSSVASQLGIGTSSVRYIMCTVSRVICEKFEGAIRLPKSAQELRRVINGFEQIAGLPYCVGAINGCHIPWLSCPDSRFYDYRCYKGYRASFCLLWLMLTGALLTVTMVFLV